MPTTTLAKAKKELDSLLDEAVHSVEPLIIMREGKPDMAIVPAASLKARRRKPHSDHVLASKTNRQRIEQAFDDLESGRVGWSGTDIGELKSQLAAKVRRGKPPATPKKSR